MRVVLRIVGVAALLQLVPSTRAYADPTTPPDTLSATMQTLPASRSDLEVVWNGMHRSALPLRIRLASQSSPLAYSMDIDRTPSYGDSWTGISLGRSDHDEDRSLPQLGVSNPLPAALIARGASGDEARVPNGDLEFAARQVAIWSVTNGLSLDMATVPSPDLLQRARVLKALTYFDANVPLTAVTHQVQIFVRETTATKVKLAIVLRIDLNTVLSTPQNIDLYLDGARLPVQTDAFTPIHNTDDGYKAGVPVPFAAGHGSTSVAEVELDRNTKVVDASATWVGVDLEPGLVMISNGAAPPLVTAEDGIVNFESTTRLDPADYTTPQQLLNRLGTELLTKLPGWSPLAAVVLALYLARRFGRVADSAIAWLFRRLRTRKPKAQTNTTIQSVEVQAKTAADAIRMALTALDRESPASVNVRVIDDGCRRLFRHRDVRLLVTAPDEANGRGEG